MRITLTIATSLPAIVLALFTSAAFAYEAINVSGGGKIEGKAPSANYFYKCDRTR